MFGVVNLFVYFYLDMVLLYAGFYPSGRDSLEW